MGIKKYFHFTNNIWFIAASCLVLGALVVLGVRFITYKPDSVHYHANFALYINGQREEFKGARYYTEIAECVLSNEMVPAERAHMHDNVNDVVHVEDHSVTWGQFFINVGWIMGPTAIIAPDGTIYTEKDTSKLHLVLNGLDYTDFGGLQNVVIHDKDKLLVSYGNESNSVLQKQSSVIPSTAQKYDMSKDPASCGGHDNMGLSERLKHLF
jgi:hypothetical protein